MKREAVIVIASVLIVFAIWSVFSVNKAEYPNGEKVIDGIVTYKSVRGSIGGGGPSLTVLEVQYNMDVMVSSYAYYGPMVLVDVANEFDYIFNNFSIYVSPSQDKELDSRFSDVSYYVDILDPDDGDTLPFKVDFVIFNEMDVGSWVKVEFEEGEPFDRITGVREVIVPGSWMHYPTKVVYTTDTSRDTKPYEIDCKEQGGTFNTCGTICPEDAEICDAVCAYTCESLTGESQSSMKGYEVYAWLDDGQWYFSLLPGTNRIKSYEEIISPSTRITGEAGLLRELRKLSPGEYVSFTQSKFVDEKSVYPELTLPPRRTMREIFEVCDEIGLNCQV